MGDLFSLYPKGCLLLFFFCFQAEDGIRYRNVTGVQTCALPIFGLPPVARDRHFGERVRNERGGGRIESPQRGLGREEPRDHGHRTPDYVGRRSAGGGRGVGVNVAERGTISQ